jgi:hypothetical protein
MSFHMLMDTIAWGTAAFFVALEVVIWGGAMLFWRDDPYHRRLEEKRAELELAKRAKTRRAWESVPRQRGY